MPTKKRKYEARFPTVSRFLELKLIHFYPDLMSWYFLYNFLYCIYDVCIYSPSSGILLFVSFDFQMHKK